MFGLVKLKMLMVDDGMEGRREIMKNVEVKARGSLSSLSGSETSIEELRCGKGGTLPWSAPASASG